MVALVRSTLQDLKLHEGELLETPAIWQTFTVTKASRELDDGHFKMSFHVIFPLIRVDQNCTTHKSFSVAMEQVGKRLGLLWSESEGGPHWDTKIYTKNRVLRLIGSQHPDQPHSCLEPFTVDTAANILAPLAIPDLSPKTLLDYTVTAFDPRDKRRHILLCKWEEAKANGEPSVAPVAPVNVQQDRLLTDTEWSHAYSQFRLYADWRVTQGWISPEALTTFPTIDRMKTGSGNPTIVFLPSPLNDNYCEHKGREHSDNASQTSYAYCMLRQVVCQMCHGCATTVQAAVSKGRPFSTAPDHMDRSLKPSFYQCVVEQEAASAICFASEHRHEFKVVQTTPPELYVFNNDKRLWSPTYNLWLYKSWPAWVNRKSSLLQKYGSLTTEQHKEVKKWTKRASTVISVTNTAKWIMNSLSDEDFQDKLNNNPMLIPLNDGTVFDIGVGKLRPRVKEDYFSWQMDFAMLPCEGALAHAAPLSNPYPSPAAITTHFLQNYESAELRDVQAQFLEYGCGDVDWVFSMRSFLAYCLTGQTFDRKYTQMVGEGANGKSSVLKSLEQLMGPFALACDQSFFTAKGNDDVSQEKPSPFLAKLGGVRLLSVAETTANVQIHTTKVKAISGGDKQTARALFSNTYLEILPICKLVFWTNFPLQIDCSDQAMVDRFSAFFWPARYVTNPTKEGEFKKDPAKANELHGRLKNAFGTWLLLGATETHKQALETGMQTLYFSPSVKAYCKQTLAAADLISSFVREEADIRSDQCTKWLVSDMWQAFTAFARTRHSEMASIQLTQFVKEMKTKAYAGVSYYIGPDERPYFNGIERKGQSAGMFDDDFVISG